eukprot:TRINITY_DN120270_c3_g1_i1.p1 TRINITY_DN120270_c3_g1~~TRINITY_DN120270_c3_g1_i1.p1  ORF type:complete len:937 (-),score=164.49 TRINITY_DN120270_c3_g1_i1:2525-5335(-)
MSIKYILWIMEQITWTNILYLKSYQNVPQPQQYTCQYIEPNRDEQIRTLPLKHIIFQKEHNHIMRIVKASLIFLILLCNIAVWTQEEPKVDPAKSSSIPEEETKKLEVQFYPLILVQEQGEKHSFQADIARLMDIIVNALYTHKEVFLRELISNASDALDKIRYLSIKDPSVLGDNKELKIMIEFNKEDKTISVTDTGIGMTKEDLVKNLGTVAKSGTAAFAEALSKGDINNLIGQFGVGFYSTYLVAKKVVVTSKNNDDDQHIWISQAGSSFSVIKDPNGNTLGRGTRVTIYLKDDAIEYVEQDTIKELAKRYSEFINYPIYIRMQKQITKEVEEEEPEKKEEEKQAEEAKKTEENVEVTEEKKEEKKEEEKKKKTVTETVWDWELVNDQKALWLRNKDEITEEEYNSFFKSLTKAAEDPLTYTHIKAEGDIEFKSILYVPTAAPYDLFENYYGRSKAIRLYVKRVLITDEFEELMPRYMNFIKGVLDSDDLPLNVNREQLQQQKVLKVITKKLVRSVIKMLENLARGKDTSAAKNKEESEEEEEEKTETPTNDTAPNSTEKYNKFWQNFGKNIKLGIIEDSSNRNSLSKLLRFYTTKSLDKLISLDDYLSRKKPKQDIIYYLAGDNKETLFKSPLLQKLKNNDIEVLLLEDPIDEYCMNSLSEYEQNRIQNAAKGDLKLFEDAETEKKKLKKLQDMYKPLTDWWRKHLGKKVEKVDVATRLTESPCVISTSEYGYSANMERISRSQAFANQDKMAGYLLARKTLEINPAHPIIKKLLDKVKEAGSADPDISVVEMSDVLFDSALLNSGFTIEDSTTYFDKIEKIVRKGFEIAEDEKIEEPAIELEEDEPKAEESSSGAEGEEKKEEEPKKEDLQQRAIILRFATQSALSFNVYWHMIVITILFICYKLLSEASLESSINRHLRSRTPRSYSSLS